MRNKLTLSQEDAVKISMNRMKDACKCTYKNLVIIRATSQSDKAVLIVFKGRSGKPVSNYCYRSYEDREKAIESWEVRANEDESYKEKRKAEKKTAGAPKSEVGTIFVSSWGYDQTNVDYYQIIERPSAHFAIVSPIGSRQVENSQGHDCCSLLPVKDQFIEGRRGDEMRVKLNRNPSGSEDFRINSFSSAHVHDGTEDYCSWYA